MPLAPMTVIETFSQTYTNGWNTSESGHAWLNPAGTASNDGRLDAASGKGTITLSSGDTSSFKSTVYVNVTNASNCGVLVKMKSSASGLAGPCLRHGDSGADYYCARMDTDDRFNICISIDGTLTELNNVSPTLATNTYYWIRFESTSTRLRARIWAEGTAESGTWDIDIAESGAVGAPDNGDCGMFYQGDSVATTVTIDSFYYYEGSSDANTSTEPDAPVRDTFATTRFGGFGPSSSGHLWYGALADDPDAYASANRELGAVASGIGSVALSTTEEIYSMIGPSMTDVMCEARFRFSSTSTNAYIGFRGTMTYSSGLAEVSDGYAVRIGESLSTIKLYERNSSGSWTEIDSVAIGFTPTSATWYRVRVLAVGSSIKATVWLDGDPEPSTWLINTTDATISSGRSFLYFDNSTSSARTTDVDDYFSGVVEYAEAALSASGTLTEDDVVLIRIRPTSDITVGTWTTSPLYDKIDESTISDSDYISSAPSAMTDTSEVKFGTPSTISVDTHHTIRYRYSKNSDQAHVDLTVELCQGASLIKAWTHTDITSTWITAEQTLTTMEASAISDYSDLRLRFTSTRY